MEVIELTFPRKGYFSDAKILELKWQAMLAGISDKFTRQMTAVMLEDTLKILERNGK